MRTPLSRCRATPARLLAVTVLFQTTLARNATAPRGRVGSQPQRAPQQQQQQQQHRSHEKPPANREAEDRHHDRQRLRHRTEPLPEKVVELAGDCGFVVNDAALLPVDLRSEAPANCSIVLSFYNATTIDDVQLPEVTNTTISMHVRLPGFVVLGVRIRRPGPIVFLSGYTIINVIATSVIPVPIATTLVPLATLLFGLLGGIALNVGTTCLGAYLSFHLLRNGCRPCFVRALGRHHGTWMALDAAFQEHGWQIPLLIRCSPISPVVITNILLSLTSITPWTYLWTTFIGELVSASLRTGGKNKAPCPCPRWLRMIAIVSSSELEPISLLLWLVHARR